PPSLTCSVIINSNYNSQHNVCCQSDMIWRLQKIVSRLAILGVVISQEDLNSNFLSSLPPEWNTHVVVWMNKPEIETMSIDDLYNNFKIIEQKVKKSVVSTGSPDVNTASPQVSTTIFNDLEAMDLKWQLSVMYEGKEDNLPGSVKHQEARKDNSEIKTTPGSKETMKTHLQR
ncbi:hypothetical protein Tco_1537242, partial [Tanacetum coccineum]